MGQILHGSARTTAAVRTAIQRSSKSLQSLARQYSINPKTVAKWRRRCTTAAAAAAAAAMGPTPVSTVLSPEQEAIAVAFRQHTQLPGADRHPDERNEAQRRRIAPCAAEQNKGGGASLYGCWKPRLKALIMCGRGHDRQPVAPGHYWQLEVPHFEGSFKTKMRVRLEYSFTAGSGKKGNALKRRDSLYSPETDVSINPGQLWRTRPKPKYYDGIDVYQPIYR